LDSFTAFKNKIGLATDKDNYLASNGDVVLNWAYKDCILEGGQTKEDQKRGEIFFNEILAPNQINRLFDDKVFVNFKRYDKNGEHEVKELNKNDNLIIKGNNLVVLHSLEKRFAGMVKLIYIDPPYNTGNDSFKYNDNFNHSTWLTFMKNRLTIAKKLLKDNGVIFVSINHIELPYIMILMDEIFNKVNKLPIITLKAGTTASYRSINDCPVNVTEYVVAYSKTPNFKPNPVYVESKYSEDYSHFIKNFSNKCSEWKLVPLTEIIHNKHSCSSWQEFKKKFGNSWKKKRYDEMEIFAFENKNAVVSLNTLQKPSQKIQAVIDESRIERNRIFVVERENNENIFCYNGRTLAFYASKFREIDGETVPSEILTNLWTDISFLGIGPEGNVTLENGKKPEHLLKTIIELITKPNDIVLDFHIGTGTTCAVAHKMSRQYIGIEQLNYGENNSVVRLQNVINGDPTGISESVNWQGGGEFVYCELANDAENFRNEVRNANAKELARLLEKAKKSSFLSCRVDRDKFNGFENLTEQEQRDLLCSLVDANTLYINYSDIENADYEISETDKKLNKQFYGK